MPGWQKLSEKEVYSCPYFRVTEDWVRKPDGSTGVYHVVDGHPAVAVVALDAENNVWLLKEEKYITGPDPIWTIPAGKVEEGESFLEAAQRELKEETGLRANQWTELGFFWVGPGRYRSRGYCYLAQDLEAGERALDATEVIEVIKKPFADVLEMIRNNQITDAWAIIPIFRAKLHLGI